MSILQNDFGALFNLIRCGNREEMERFHMLANKHHDPLAQAALATVYFNGYCHNVGKDADLAINFASACLSWLHSQRDKNSYFCLGEFYWDGIGVAVDQNEALRFWRMGAEAGSELAQNCLGYYEYTRGNHSDSLEWYLSAAGSGYCVALDNVGCCYRDGRCGPRNLAEAARLFQLAVDQGYSLAQNNLACMYFDGEGLDQDWKEATRLFRLAAEQGDDSGQYNLGTCYYRGEGVSIDFVEAAYWMQLAADQGHAQAQLMMCSLHRYGHGVALNDAEMVAWCRLAADKNHTTAQLILGWCYEHGKGVQVNTDEAIRLYKLSSDQGNTDADAYLENLLAKSNGESSSDL